MRCWSRMPATRPPRELYTSTLSAWYSSSLRSIAPRLDGSWSFVVQTCPMNEAQRDRKDHISFRLQTAPELGNRLRSKPRGPMSDSAQRTTREALRLRRSRPKPHACDRANTVAQWNGAECERKR